MVPESSGRIAGEERTETWNGPADAGTRVRGRTLNGATLSLAGKVHAVPVSTPVLFPPHVRFRHVITHRSPSLGWHRTSGGCGAAQLRYRDQRDRR